MSRVGAIIPQDDQQQRHNSYLLLHVTIIQMTHYTQRSKSKNRSDSRIIGLMKSTFCNFFLIWHSLLSRKYILCFISAIMLHFILYMLYFWYMAAAVVADPTSTSTIFDGGVPTAVPVPGNYSGDLRPQIHFSPPKNFMNDPNGCFLDADGLWHLYYQCV